MERECVESVRSAAEALARVRGLLPKVFREVGGDYGELVVRYLLSRTIVMRDVIQDVCRPPSGGRLSPSTKASLGSLLREFAESVRRAGSASGNPVAEALRLDAEALIRFVERL